MIERFDNATGGILHIMIMKWNNAMCLNFLTTWKTKCWLCTTHKTIVFWLKVHAMHLFRVWILWLLLFHLLTFICHAEGNWLSYCWQWSLIISLININWYFDFLQIFQSMCRTFRFSILSSAELMFHKMQRCSRMQVRLLVENVFSPTFYGRR